MPSVLNMSIIMDGEIGIFNVIIEKIFENGEVQNTDFFIEKDKLNFKTDVSLDVIVEMIKQVNFLINLHK